MIEVKMRISKQEYARRRKALMNQMEAGHPWQLSYSYGRALQAHALKTWAEGGADSSAASQDMFAHRAKMNSLARCGDWSLDLEA